MRITGEVAQVTWRRPGCSVTLLSEVTVQSLPGQFGWPSLLQRFRPLHFNLSCKSNQVTLCLKLASSVRIPQHRCQGPVWPGPGLALLPPSRDHLLSRILAFTPASAWSVCSLSVLPGLFILRVSSEEVTAEKPCLTLLLCRV